MKVELFMKSNRYALNFAEKPMPTSSSGFSPLVVQEAIKNTLEAAVSVLNYVSARTTTREMAKRNDIAEEVFEVELDEYSKQRQIQYDGLVRRLNERLATEKRELELAADEFRMLTEERISEMKQDMDEYFRANELILKLIKKENEYLVRELKPAMEKLPLAIRKTTIYQQYSDSETLALMKINDLLNVLIK